VVDEIGARDGARTTGARTTDGARTMMVDIGVGGGGKAGKGGVKGGTMTLLGFNGEGILGWGGDGGGCITMG
jgi:hypothetical protein